jgi:hypothetical protein
MKSMDNGRVGCFGHHQHIWFVPLQTLIGFEPRVQFQRAVDAVDPRVVLAMPFDTALMQKVKPDAPALPRVRQLDQQIRDLFLLGF